MCSRFFHVFAESSSPSLARFSLREVGLISTLYVFGDAFWLPICKSGSSQPYKHRSTVGWYLKSPVQVKNSVSVYIDRDSDRDRDKNNREKNYIDRNRDDINGY